jgi:hypothetical protein
MHCSLKGITMHYSHKGKRNSTKLQYNICTLEQSRSRQQKIISHECRIYVEVAAENMYTDGHRLDDVTIY